MKKTLALVALVSLVLFGVGCTEKQTKGEQFLKEPATSTTGILLDSKTIIIYASGTFPVMSPGNLKVGPEETEGATTTGGWFPLHFYVKKIEPYESPFGQHLNLVTYSPESYEYYTFAVSAALTPEEIAAAVKADYVKIFTQQMKEAVERQRLEKTVQEVNELLGK